MLRNPILLIIPVILVVAICLALAENAEAKRFGGGRSFGSKPSFSQSYSKPISPSGGTTTSRQGLTNTGTGFRRPGLGGLFGGLLMGGLLGSLFFGGPFMGPNFMDILLVGLGLFFVMRLFRRNAATAHRQQGYSPHGYDQNPLNRDSSYGGAWDNLRSDNGHGQATTPNVQPAVNVPDGFDTEDFLKGAKAFFTRLQLAWDNRDLSDVRQFVSPEVLNEVEQQAKLDPQPSRTEILLINARLLEVVEEDGFLRASVYYDVLLHEDTRGGNPEQVREVWHFRRSAAEDSSTWTLEGIQQLQ